MTRQAVFLSILVALLLVIAWWFLLFQPAQEELAMVEEEIVAVEDQIRLADAEIAALEDIRANAAQIQAEISTAGAVVPEDPGLPALLRQVQAAADDSGIELVTLNPSRPVDLPEAGTTEPLAAINIAMDAEGSYFQMVDFLRRLAAPELVARGLLVQDVSAALGEEYPTLTVAITAQVFATIDAPPALEEPAAEEEATEDGATPDGEGTDAETGEDGATTTEEDAA